MKLIIEPLDTSISLALKSDVASEEVKIKLIEISFVVEPSFTVLLVIVIVGKVISYDGIISFKSKSWLDS